MLGHQVVRIYLDLPETAASAVAYRDALPGHQLHYAGDSAALASAEVLVAGKPVDGLLAAAPAVRWVAFWNAGIDPSLTPALLARIEGGLLVTNASGMHGPQMAEHAFAMILAFSRGLQQFTKRQARHQWKREGANDSQVEELAGQTLGIVGLGHIGEALAVRARAFDMKVQGVRRSHTSEELDALLSTSDHVVVLAPLTPETRHLIDAGRLAKMKPTARLYNLARGPLVDEAALIDALRTHRIAGAGLDVFETEPLPETSPLWDLDNVIVSPHLGGATPHYFTRAAALFAANVARFERGEPLQQLHDAARGY